MSMKEGYYLLDSQLECDLDNKKVLIFADLDKERVQIVINSKLGGERTVIGETTRRNLLTYLKNYLGLGE